MKKIKSLFLLALSMTWQIIKESIVGRVADAECEHNYEVGGTVCYPTNQPSFNEWCEMFNVSKACPNVIVMSKEQIADKLGISSSNLRII